MKGDGREGSSQPLEEKDDGRGSHPSKKMVMGAEGLPRRRQRKGEEEGLTPLYMRLWKEDGRRAYALKGKGDGREIIPLKGVMGERLFEGNSHPFECNGD